MKDDSNLTENASHDYWIDFILSSYIYINTMYLRSCKSIYAKTIKRTKQ